MTGVSISIRGGARRVVGRIGTRGISMVGVGVRVGSVTLSESIVLMVGEVCKLRRMGDLGFMGEEEAEEGDFFGGFAVRTETGAIVETVLVWEGLRMRGDGFEDCVEML
jgi:hypothetical protein